MVRALFLTVLFVWTLGNGGQLPNCVCCQYNHKSIGKMYFWPWKQNLHDWSVRCTQSPMLFCKHLHYCIQTGPWTAWLDSSPANFQARRSPAGVLFVWKVGKQKTELEGVKEKSLVPAGESLQVFMPSGQLVSTVSSLPFLSRPFRSWSIKGPTVSHDSFLLNSSQFASCKH